MTQTLNEVYKKALMNHPEKEQIIAVLQQKPHPAPIYTGSTGVFIENVRLSSMTEPPNNDDTEEVGEDNRLRSYDKWVSLLRFLLELSPAEYLALRFCILHQSEKELLKKLLNDFPSMTKKEAALLCNARKQLLFVQKNSAPTLSPLWEKLTQSVNWQENEKHRTGLYVLYAAPREYIGNVIQFKSGTAFRYKPVSVLFSVYPNMPDRIAFGLGTSNMKLARFRGDTVQKMLHEFEKQLHVLADTEAIKAAWQDCTQQIKDFISQQKAFQLCP